MTDREHSTVKQAGAEDTLAALGELENLLNRQTELVRQGQMRDVEALAKQASDLVERMSNCGIFESAEFADRRDDLERLYANLHLGLGAERAKTAEQLSQVRKGIKTVSTYRQNM
jgi:hypothetical protein